MRILSLDILRAIAVLLVLGRHINLMPDKMNAFEWTLFSNWQRFGWIGVDLFFVLSGFLVSGLLFKEHQKYGSVELGRFFIRRGFKIYPPFYFLMACTFLKFTVFHNPIVPLGFVSELLFVQNYFHGVWIHTWTLAIEEHFYLFIGVTLFLCSKWQRKNPFFPILYGFPLVAFGILLLRMIHSQNSEFSDLTHLSPTHLRMDSLFFGVWISYFFHYHAEALKAFVSRYSKLLWVLSLSFISPMLVLNLDESPFVYTFGFSFLYLGFGGVLVLTLFSKVNPPDGFRPIANFLGYIGKYSYSIYLWHLVPKSWGMGIVRKMWGLDTPYFVELIVYFGGALFFGILIGKYLEFPFLKVRDRYFKSRSKA